MEVNRRLNFNWRYGHLRIKINLHREAAADSWGITRCPPNGDILTVSILYERMCQVPQLRSVHGRQSSCPDAALRRLYAVIGFFLLEHGLKEILL